MELRHLRYFLAAAQHQHFTRAAQQLGIAQPPLSQQIRELEREIGTPLFHRRGRGVVLSEAGLALKASAEDILRRVDEARAAALRASRGETGLLRLGFTESASFNPAVTHAIGAFRARYPNVDVRLEEDHSESLVQRLAQGGMDAAFVRPPFVMDGVTFTPLVQEDLVVVLPAGHPLARRRRLRLEHLRGHAFILYARESGYGLSADIMAACRQQGFSPAIAQHAPQLSSAVNLVAAGMGIAVVPASMQALRASAVQYRPLDAAWPKAMLGLATASAATAVQSAVIANFAALAKGWKDG